MAALPALDTFDVPQLLAIHAAVLDELKLRKVVRSVNGPAGDYAEQLGARAFGWTLAGGSVSGHDAYGEGLRYQIKSRRLTLQKSSRQLSVLRQLPERKFDHLLGILFNSDFTVRRAALIPHAMIEPRASFRAHVNGWIFHLTDDVWSLAEVRDVTSEIQAAANAAWT